MSGRLADVLVRSLVGSTARSRELVAVDRALRRPVSTSRRISVVQVGGGSGATTLTARTAAVLAARRAGGVLAVDAAAGPTRLAARVGVRAPLDLASAVQRTAGVTKVAEVRSLLPTTSAGLAVVGSGGQRPAAVEQWRAATANVGRFFDVVLTDWGHRSPDELVQVATLSHVVAVVARADRGDAERALAAARLAAAALGSQDRGAPAWALVLVDVGASRTGGFLRGLAGESPEAFVLPHADELAQDRWQVPLGPRAELAYAGTAAALLDLSLQERGEA